MKDGGDMGVKKDKEHPLAGVVLCFTSILPEQRTELATIASQMGATHKFDLTSDVTHLLVGEPNTPKYKYVARERSDVVVLMPGWVEAVRQSWIQGGDTDLKALEEQYKLPTFSGLSICVTGFEDLAFRNHIQDTAIANGADFRKDLTKSVTHLLARNTEGQKYKFATQWNIKVVSVKWFTESLERGMILEETLYHPLTPTEKQGIGAWNRSLPPVLEKRAEPTDPSNPQSRKLRRIASTKLGDQNEGIWSDIMGKGFDTTDQLETETDQWKVEERPTVKARSVIQEAKSFASETTVAERQDSHPQLTTADPVDQQRGFLHGCYFFMYGFSSKQANVLRHHLQLNGAQVVASLSEFASPDIPKTGYGLYAIVPFKADRSDTPSTDDMAFEVETVTDMWLERCLDSRALVPPESHVTSTPLPKFPIEEFRGMKVCSTGFSGIDLLHLSRLVTLMGATYDEYLTPSASVLICNDPRTASQEKLRHTYEWGIPTVSADWLWISVQTGKKKAFDSYLIQRPPSQGDKAVQPRPGKTAKRNQDLPEQITAEKDRKESDKAVIANVQPTEEHGNASNSDDRNGISEKSAAAVQKGSPLKQMSTNSSISLSASPSRSSSTKEQNMVPAPADPVECQESNQSRLPSASATSKVFDLAVSGLLKQARAGSRSSSNSGETSEQSRPKRRRPLLGRAGSYSSTRPAGPSAFSRASSIDTLNEDGCGSGAESLDTDTNNKPTRNSKSAQSFNSVISGSRLDLFGDHPRLYRDASRELDEDEDQTPAMTQLNYEDPDAVAMREEFMNRAGKGGEKKSETKQGIVVGQVRELEDIGGWATGRRTRRGGKIAEPDNGLF